MRAVNQSIGRSIRHAGDYSSILLVDERYRDDQVRVAGYINVVVSYGSPETFQQWVLFRCVGVIFHVYLDSPVDTDSMSPKSAENSSLENAIHKGGCCSSHMC